ncbi:hypothetical protein ACTFIW_001411, partial [Dictyostelium discoideum]
KKMNKKKLI